MNLDHLIMNYISLSSKEYKLLNWLNYKNIESKDSIFLAEIDELTGEIKAEKEIEFKVDECKYYITKTISREGYKEAQMFRLYRFKPVLFYVGCLKLVEFDNVVKTRVNKSSMKDIELKGLQACFEFDTHTFESLKIGYEQHSLNIVQVHKLLGVSSQGKYKESREMYQKIFQSFLQQAFGEIEPIDFSHHNWYNKINFI